MNKEIIKSMIDESETKLRYCFNMLINSQESQAYKLLFEFQPILAETLYDLMKFYQKLCAEEKNLVSKKFKLNYTWFSKQMKQLSKYKDAVSKTICIGKCLGDAFVWLFYENNKDELEKHLSHKETGLFPVGIGGYAEVEFIKENNNIGGCFVLYHGITNILRIGDFSLFAVDNGIIGTGELKSEKNINNTIVVHAYIFSQYMIHHEKLGHTIDADENYVVFNQERFQRQIKAITTLLEKTISTMQQNIYSDNAFSILDDFYKAGKHVKVSYDKAVLAFGICSHSMKLSNNLLSSKKEAVSIPSELIDKTKEILIENSAYNQIIYGQLDNKLCHGQIPILWWGTNAKTIEKIIFKQLQIMTLYNTAHVYEYFYENGFKITINKNHQAIIEKSKNGKRMTIENISLFNHLVLTNFMPVKVFLEAFEPVIIKMDSGEIESNIKCTIKIFQH